MNKFIRAEDIMSKGIFVVDSNSTIMNASKLMLKYRTPCLIVMEKTKPVGIFTENDAVRVLSKNLDPKKEKIKEHMSEPIITNDAESSFFEVLQTMRDKKIKRIPIMKDKTIVGVVSETDITKGIVYINKIINRTLREGYITIDEHKKQEESLLSKLLSENRKKEPPWVKKEFDLLKKIYQDQEEVIKSIKKPGKKYSLTEWRMNIWTNCKYKSEEMKNNEIIYLCKKMKGFCVYKKCPLNKT